mmetsp:Transcript_18767/g.26431  ORF Transcript_18767/g.26431 Transcript_18767/m.26431 type:complete len:465 (+) Transcript_18767:140-1534(+)|eukprot:CAMPEP_0184855626 /NCGR_PEP_ID=MMETSP0580-20130426/808_1 /TAXON_ID=1118495 /ORGANISM="Dactyliosolen fragilissimus" /LENGTH=464 /DNA_ID=CAMNT_0027350181 /DNA_START=117 /DNA_END=1511 /DNA_ORIENTATION=+
MAPNADPSRLRNRFANSGAEIDTSEIVTRPSNQDIVKSLKGTEVIIDDAVYDLEGFQHPGGDSVFLFGGNDVTVQYKMIHPYHTSKHLEKMKFVRKVPLMQKDYIFDTEFEREIKREVFKIVRRGREFGTYGYFFRAFFYIGLMFTLQYRWATSGASWALAICFGISQAFIGLNVQHDANHGAASKKPWVNDLLGFGADLIGGSKWNWMQQHWTHHAYTNHGLKDPDSFSAEPMLLFNDYPLDHPMRTFYAKFNAFFVIPVLSGYWLSTVFNTQIIDLQHKGAEFVGIRMDNDFIMKRRKYSVLLRLMYIYLNIVRPLQIAFNGTTVLQILLMGVSESLMLSGLFILSHNFENADRDPTNIYKNGEKKPVCWFKSQVETSSTYGGFISGCLTGGLNFQVEHHLFPRMSSAYYPFIAPKIREICKKHGVRYAYYPYVWQNFISTFKYMHQAGNGTNWMNPLKGDL